MQDSHPAAGENDSLEAGILEDQLADLRTGLFISMPISTALSVLILLVELLAGGGLGVVSWFVAVNVINGARIAYALKHRRPKGARRVDVAAARRRLRPYKVLALISGIAWACLAILTDGYTVPQSGLHLIILAGISAGAVTYSGAYAALPINFITPPLLVGAACLAANGGFENCILAFAVLLFLGGLVRSSFIGEARFREASRLKHEAEQVAAEMERRSREDPLTSLLNRRGLEHAIDQLDATDSPFVTMLIDLDGFKSVNDTYGHKVGDDLLVKIAHRIMEKAPEGATLARIGGDEFVLLFPTFADPRAPEALAAEIITRIASSYPTVASVRVGASMGIYLAERPRLTDILLRADIALYTAKNRGRNEFCLFDAELEQVLERRQCIERDIRSAIETGSLGTWYQPIVRLDTGSVVGFEALLRWSHALHGPITPPEIVTAARETGMLQMLTEMVFANCCTMIGCLLKAGHHEMRVAMNLSPRELEAGNIDDMILSGLEEKGLPATMFEIEITEEAPVDPDRVDEKLGRLCHAGISVALDDFGTGFSTLASLKDGRISKVKIDKVFIRGLGRSPKDQHLVKAVVDLGRGLGIEVMAEGVETESDRKTLQALGCMTAQGYLFSKALPLQEALALAEGQSVRPR